MAAQQPSIYNRGDFSSSAVECFRAATRPIGDKSPRHRLLKSAAILRVAHRNLIIQRPEVIQHPQKEQPASQQIQ